MKTSQAGINLIKSFESLQLTAYVCPAGILTIGYGHTGPDVVSGQRYSEQQAEAMLKKDLAWAEEAVTRNVKIQLNQSQFDALVSFTYNVGAGALEESTLLKRLNDKEDPYLVVKQELPKWCKGDHGSVLQGLVRRRNAEVELFCSAPAVHLTGDVTISAKQPTWLKKKPLQVGELASDEKVQIWQSRTFKNCTILGHEDGHTQLEFGYGLGTWWVFDAHWNGLKTVVSVGNCAVDGNLHYLRNFPYFWQQDNGPEGWRQCQTSSIAMILKYLDVKGINDDTDYLKYVNKHGDTTTREAHYEALAELKVKAEFRTCLDAGDIKEQIDRGMPVAVGILHHGSVSGPRGGGHFIVISGYSDSFWLVQDPYGELDLVDGMWASQTPTAGKNKHYSFQNLDPRLFVGGKSNGWGWLNFKYTP